MIQKKIDSKLYKTIFIDKNVTLARKLWEEIKQNKTVLTEAIKKTKDKFNQYDTVKGLTICNQILFDYENIDKSIYQELINLIYSNIDIARIVVDGASNGGYSYLLVSLFNHNLKLTKEQKEFAVSEAMNKVGTTYYKKLVYDFYYDDEDWIDHLDNFCWNIINEICYYIDNDSSMDLYFLYECTYEDLLELLNDKSKVNGYWNEIEFCRNMKNLRHLKYKEEVFKRYYNSIQCNLTYN